MAEVSNEPSMEEILSSIKRIIAEEGDQAVAGAKARASQRRPREEPDAEPDEVLELTEAVAAEEEVPSVTEPAPVTEPAMPPEPAPVLAKADAPPAELVSPNAASASRDALASLSAMVVKPDAPGNTLEGLVREMLKPMLKDWLDANLPELVEKLVAREIARISGKSI